MLAKQDDRVRAYDRYPILLQVQAGLIFFRSLVQEREYVYLPVQQLKDLFGSYVLVSHAVRLLIA